MIFREKNNESQIFKCGKRRLEEPAYLRSKSTRWNCMDVVVIKNTVDVIYK